MSDPVTFNALADELERKVEALGNLGLTMKFVFEGEGNVLIDARKDVPTLTRNDEAAADFTVIGPLNVWLDSAREKAGAACRRHDPEDQIPRRYGARPQPRAEDHDGPLSGALA